MTVIDDVMAQVAALPPDRKVELALDLLRSDSERCRGLAITILRLALRDLMALAEVRSALPTDRRTVDELRTRMAGVGR